MKAQDLTKNMLGSLYVRHKFVNKVKAQKQAFKMFLKSNYSIFN